MLGRFQLNEDFHKSRATFYLRLCTRHTMSAPLLIKYLVWKAFEPCFWCVIADQCWQVVPYTTSASVLIDGALAYIIYPDNQDLSSCLAACENAIMTGAVHPTAESYCWFAAPTCAYIERLLGITPGGDAYNIFTYNCEFIFALDCIYRYICVVEPAKISL